MKIGQSHRARAPKVELRSKHAAPECTSRRPDGFDRTARSPVKLGQISDASVAADLALFTELIQALTNRASVQPAVTTPQVSTPTVSTPTPNDSFRQLIAADIKTAYGRDATDADYAYWLPKLQGPNDSGFVTSGQMTATEYWHRRMLGWQAGGADQARFGPYAGGSEARGPVPSATDVMAGAPSTGDVAPSAPSGSLVDAYRRLITADFKLATGHDPSDGDMAYWLEKLTGPNDSGFVTSGQMTATEYWHRRMLGWQAGGADQAQFGPYAGSSEANGPVPTVSDMVGALPAA